jgi:hypothetical protein
VISRRNLENAKGVAYMSIRGASVWLLQLPDSADGRGVYEM